MKFDLWKEFLLFRNSKDYFVVLIFLIITQVVSSQTYPEELQLSDVTYQPYESPIGDFPDYLQPFTESLSGNTVTRISDKDIFGTTSQRLRHNYAKDQTWNLDGSLIKLAGYPAAILDGETFEFLYWSDIPSYGRWSNTNPHEMYGTPSNQFVKFNVITNENIVLRTFDDYDDIDFGFGEGNQSNDDRFVGLIGLNGNDRTLIVYDIVNDQITGTKHIGTAGDLDWFSVSQSGDFAVACWRDQGSGITQGIKSYDINMLNEQHVIDYSSHGDLGIDTNGNDVFVGYHGQDGWDQGYYLYAARLDGGGTLNLFDYSGGIWGGHISCRNTDRPGWAYVSEQCCTDHPIASREIFAIKLDGSGTIERYTKHNNDISPGNGHSTQAVPNRDGTKVLFASNWDDELIKLDNNPPSWILEVPQESNQTITANAGEDVSICQGDMITLTATGGSNYEWSTGATTQSIEVNPETTTTYLVTVFEGNLQDTDDVIVNVNALPTVNAGDDITIAEGYSVTLTASGGTSYEWSNGDTTQSIEVNPDASSIYTVTVTNSNGCSAIDSVYVEVVDAVVADAGENVDICRDDSITLTATGGSNYEWSTGETTQSIIVSPTHSTNYTVIVSDDYSSDADSVGVRVSNCAPSLGVGDASPNNANQIEFDVFPNPTSSTITVKISGIDVSTIYLHDMLGKTLINEFIPSTQDQSIIRTYDLSQYEEGIYLLSFIRNGKAYTKRVAVN